MLAGQLIDLCKSGLTFKRRVKIDVQLHRS